MSIEAMAVAFVAATKKRAQARRHLSALRKKWQDDNDTFFDQSESDGMEGYHDMMGALHDREMANAEYRLAKSRLFRACALGVKESPESRRERLIANGYKTDSRCKWLAIGRCAECGREHRGDVKGDGNA